MSVLYHLGTTVETISGTVPYLMADPALIAPWRRELAALPGFKIGINWQGNPESQHDKHRSLPLKEFAPRPRFRGFSW
jgi:hypothetical protein